MVHVMVVGRLRLRESRGGERHPDKERPHGAPPSSGRTVTTRIIPACMWSSRWQ
jgi:hypothetical protein